MRELARAGVPPMTAVIAGAQTQGRGRVGRGWFSPADSGLWLSVLLPDDRSGFSGILPLAVGVAAARALERLIDGQVRLKWPNDLLLGDRKLGGILCEALGDPGDGVIVGLGINLRPPLDDVPGELVDSIAYLEGTAGREVHEPLVAKWLLAELMRWTWPVPMRLDGRLRAEWESRDCICGRRIMMEDGGRGRAESVAHDGALVVRLDGGQRVNVRSGSVRLDSPGGSGALHAEAAPGFQVGGD